MMDPKQQPAGQRVPAVGTAADHTADGGTRVPEADRADGLPPSTEALYAYCFATTAALTEPLAAKLAATPAIDPARPVRVHRTRDLAAVLSPVRRAELEGEQGEANLADIGWVGPRALRHQAVIEQAMAEATVLPLPFGTLFSSPTALERAMVEGRPRILAVLERLGGCEEWAVQGTLDRQQALAARLAAAIAAGDYVPAAAPGRRHLEEQRLRREWERDIGAWALAAADDLAHDLTALAHGFVERRIPAGQELLFNWAFLVPTRALTRFRARIEAAAEPCRERGLHLGCKGPWPPYSFCGD
jgi:hypothetical protein